jgi:hypothetical protein
LLEYTAAIDITEEARKSVIMFAPDNTMALSLTGQLYCNRALAALKLGMYEQVCLSLLP